MLYELKTIGHKTRYFTDSGYQHEIECICPEQLPTLPGERQREVRVELEACPAHGRARNPQNWPVKPFFDPNWRDKQ